jgi:hypothetical protein
MDLGMFGLERSSLTSSGNLRCFSRTSLIASQRA